MITFWILAAVMLAVALGFIIPPLLRRPEITGYTQDDVNVVIYRERLEALQAALDEGSLSSAQFEQAQQELQQELVADLSPVATQSPSATTQGRWGAVVAALTVGGVAIALYLQLGTMPLPSEETALAQLDAAEQAERIDAMVAGLAQRLEENPANPEGWVMLGRSYQVLERFPEASRAFARAHELIGDEPWLLADYAEAEAYAQGGDMGGEPTELVLRALKQDPDHQKALWLAGIAAAQQGNPALAATRWRRLLALLPADGEGARQVQALLARLESEGIADAVQEGSTTAALSAPTAALKAQVSLAPDLSDQVVPTDTVFIFARAAEGPPMPLAVLRKQVKDLPVTVVLDDSMAMVPEMRLSRFPEVRVVAQVSRSGNAVAQSGDLRGSSAPVAVGDEGNVAVVIDQVIP